MNIRVLHVVTKMDAAGIETLIMNWYRNINRKKIQFDFLVHREDEGFYDKEILKLGGRIYRVPSINPFHHRKYINSLNDFFKRHKEYSIVHSHLNTYSMWPLRAAKKAGIPIRISHSHISNVPFDHKTLFRMYTKSKLTNYTTNNFACSMAAGKWLFGNSEKITVINNAIDAEKYLFDKEIRMKIRKEMNIENNLVIGHVGRFAEQKNHNFLLDVFYEVHQINPNSKLILTGDGPLRSKIEGKIKKLNLENNVILTGVISDVNEIMQAFDIFILPSFYEGLGIVAIEAQAAGLPTIVSDTTPKEVFITDNISSLSLDKTPKEWAQYILSYKRNRTWNAHQNIIEAGFDIYEETRKIEKFYIENSQDK